MVKNIAIVGIFDRFHEGHKYAIKEALNRGETLHILFLHTGDKFTHPDKRVDLVEPFEKRIKNVKDFIKSLEKEDKVKYYGEDGRIGLPPVFGWEVLRDCEDLNWIQCEADKNSYTPFEEVINFIRTHAYGLNPMIPVWIKAVTDENGNKISSSKLRKDEKLCRVADSK
jgi:cytidyltransferase-like protein